MKKRTILVLGLAGITLFAGLLLFGCAHTQSVRDDGTIQQGDDEDMAQQINKGKTTRNMIIKAFGVPDRTVETGVGKNQEVYVYEHVRWRPFGGVEKKETLVWINKDTGLVEDYSYKEED